MDFFVVYGLTIISVIITILAGLYINRKENRRYKNK